MAEVSFPVSTVGLVIPFVLTEEGFVDGQGAVLSNAVSITSCIWVSERGMRRELTMSQPVSATFTYTISAGDSRFPHVEAGYLEVRYGTNVFFGISSFMMNIHQHF